MRSPYLEEGVNEEVGDWWVGSCGIQHVRPSVGEIEEQLPWQPSNDNAHPYQVSYLYNIMLFCSIVASTLQAQLNNKITCNHFRYRKSMLVYKK